MILFLLLCAITKAAAASELCGQATKLFFYKMAASIVRFLTHQKTAPGRLEIRSLLGMSKVVSYDLIFL